MRVSIELDSTDWELILAELDAKVIELSVTKTPITFEQLGLYGRVSMKIRKELDHVTKKPN